jgi:hypothetical protein
MSHSTNAVNQARTTGVEEDEIDIRGILGFAIGLAVVTIIAHVLMLWMFHAEVASIDASNPPRVYPLAATDQEDRRPPEPRLQGGVKADAQGRLLPDSEVEDRNYGVREALKVLRDEEHEALTTYGWVDRNNQIVRIPIEDAMKRTLEVGLPSRPAANGEAPGSAAPATQESK